MTTYLVQKIDPPTTKGEKWLLGERFDDGTKNVLGFHTTKKACKTVAGFIAGWRNPVEVNTKAIRIDAWRVDA
jgi:hypothetical protein